MGSPHETDFNLKMYIRKICTELAIDEAGLAAAFGVEFDDPKRDHKVEIEVRRQLIFANDATVYKNIRMVSDGVEHGFKSWEEMWSVPDDTVEKSARYLRNAILYAADLPDAAYQTLNSDKYAAPVEAGDTLAFEATAPVSRIDLRAANFRIAKVERVMTKSEFNETAGEYRYDYRLEAPK